MRHQRNLLPIVGLLTLLSLITGCASTPNGDPGDPYEATNRKIYNFNDSIDRNVLQPVARGYVTVAPKPVRSGVTNFFDNVGYINVILNDALQGKPGQFFSDTGRFVVNSTIGLGGLFDPAKEMGLMAHDEDLGQTFGVWGAGEGAYLNIPLAGPSSFRDAPGFLSALLLNPLTYLNPIVTLPLSVVNAVNIRANLLEATNIRDQAALDPYTFVREAYRQQREFRIYDGNPPGDGFDDYLEGDGDSAILRIY
ncbi:MAG: VacJ family lipoprotein [Proteobacteria bacterium]|nr:VacJ family lipoprotein [Pseudomonadota bacterium]